MSKLEDTLALQLRAAGIAKRFEREVRFHPTRRWRLDFADIESRIGVEVEGTTRYGRNRDGSMRLGRHQTAKGYAEDCAKYNAAILLGWRVLRFDGEMVKSGAALATIREVLEIETTAASAAGKP